MSKALLVIAFLFTSIAAAKNGCPETIVVLPDASGLPCHGGTIGCPLTDADKAQLEAAPAGCKEAGFGDCAANMIRYPNGKYVISCTPRDKQL